MNDFSLWFYTGLQHIADLKAYDHILFLVALTASYNFQSWRTLLLLITAFTLGHSITLAASSLNIIHIKSSWIEFLIPITILLTSVRNVWSGYKGQPKTTDFHYLMTLIFGFIHGMGFSYLLKSLLGKQAFILLPLLAFNLGLEVGQLLILMVIFMLSFLGSVLFKTNDKNRQLIISLLVSGISVVMALERFTLIINN